MIQSVVQPLMPNLVFVRSAGACLHIGEVVTPGVYFLPFFLFLLLTSLLTYTDRIVDRRNIVNGSKDVFQPILVPIWGLIKIFKSFDYFLQKS